MYIAVGAAYMKHVRAGDLVAVVLLAQVVWLSLLEIGRSLIRRRAPFGFRRLGASLVGMLRSFELGIDSEAGLRQPKEPRVARA